MKERILQDLQAAITECAFTAINRLQQQAGLTDAQAISEVVGILNEGGWRCSFFDGEDETACENLNKD